MPFTPQHAAVWFELPVADLDRAMAFYESVFGYDLTSTDGGPNQIAMFPTETERGLSGHLYPGQAPANGTGPTVHMTVPDTVEATAERWERAGGSVGGPVIEIPPGRFQYATDPDGNSIGLFQPAA